MSARTKRWLAAIAVALLGAVVAVALGAGSADAATAPSGTVSAHATGNGFQCRNFGTIEVSGQVTGLTPNTEYTVLITGSANGSVSGTTNDKGVLNVSGITGTNDNAYVVGQTYSWSVGGASGSFVLGAKPNCETGTPTSSGSSSSSASASGTSASASGTTSSSATKTSASGTATKTDTSGPTSTSAPTTTPSGLPGGNTGFGGTPLWLVVVIPIGAGIMLFVVLPRRRRGTHAG